MAYKPVGADENGKFPPRVEAALNATIGEQVSAAIAEIPTADPTFTTSAWQVGGTPPVYPRMTTITTFGSSSVSGLSAALPTTFTPMGVSIVNRAQSGERWEHTLARNGIVPAIITFPSDTVQASGSATVTTTLPTTFNLLTYRGKLAGTEIIGTLSLSGGVFTFNRETAGTALALSGPVSFIPMPTNAAGVPLNPSYRDTMAILDLGKNNADYPGTAESINAAMDALVAWLVPMVKRYLILGLFANTGSSAAHKANIAAVNAHRASIGGDKYLDLQGYVTGSDVWTHTGITPTQTDLNQQAAGEKPDSLSVDAGHLTSTAWNAFITHVIKPKLSTLGWYTFPDITAGLKARWDATTLAVADGASITSWPTSAGDTLTLDQKPGSGWAFPTMAAAGGPAGTKAAQFTRSAFSYIGSNSFTSIGQPYTQIALVKTSIGGTVIGGSTSAARMFGNTTDWTTSGAYANAIANPDGPDNTWQVVTLVVDGTNSSLYVNGNRVAGSISASATMSRVCVGGVVNGTAGWEADFLDGLIAETAWWTRALTDAEVQTAVSDIRTRHGL